jgi:uncharacterized repeat protein (TIGR01451 family)
VVSNAASGGPTAGEVTVTDTLPVGLTASAAAGSGWACTISDAVACTRADALAPGASYPPITVTVNVAVGAPATVTNTATVEGGGDITPANDTASDSTTIIPAPAPNLNITNSHTGTFTEGQAGSYDIVVSNAASGGPTSGVVTVTDTLPPGLTATAAAGTGWTCTVGPTVTCTRSDILAPGASYPPITLTANIAANAPTTITDTATVMGGGSASKSASDTVSVAPLPAPSLSITKSHSGTFGAGQTGAYTIVVKNAAGGGPTSGPVTVTDPLPAGLTATAAAVPVGPAPSAPPPCVRATTCCLPAPTTHPSL